MKVEPRFDILHENAGKFVILLFLCCPICIVSADENFTAFRMKDIAGKSEETFENISQTFEERAGNVTEEAIVQPPRWQEWLDNSQIAISVIGKSVAVRCHHKFYISLNSIASFSLKNGDLNSTTNQNMFHFITILTRSKLSDILLAIITARIEVGARLYFHRRL